ncbi:uncharacterized protein [Miscanthus floridulus]|uniref:uncharacterized protein isoform X1 n=1 Tax=Miscanthus floridulus TaxID=154761 RepID=UPI00345ACCA5
MQQRTYTLQFLLDWLLLSFNTCILVNEYVFVFPFYCQIILTNEPVYLLSAMTMDTGNKYLLYWLCPYGKGFFPVLYSVVYLKNVLAAMTCSQQTTVIMKMTHIYLTPQVMYLDAATTSSARATTKSQIHPAAPDVSNNTTRYCQMTRSALPYQQPEAFHV